MNRISRVVLLFAAAFAFLFVFQQYAFKDDPLMAAAKQERGFIPTAEEVFKTSVQTEFVPSEIAPAEPGFDNPPEGFTKASAQETDEEEPTGDGVSSATDAGIIEDLVKSNEERAERYKKGEIDFYLLRQTRYYEDQPPAFAKELKALKDKKVKMIGFMSPYDDLNSMKKFMLMPMMTGCFFCVPPSIEEVVLIRQETDEHCPYIAEPIVVEGTLKLWDEESEDPVFEMFLYIIEDATVRVYDPEKDARTKKVQDHNQPH